MNFNTISKVVHLDDDNGAINFGRVDDLSNMLKDDSSDEEEKVNNRKLKIRMLDINNFSDDEDENNLNCYFQREYHNGQWVNQCYVKTINGNYLPLELMRQPDDHSDWETNSDIESRCSNADCSECGNRDPIHQELLSEIQRTILNDLDEAIETFRRES
jgi:hypothetical protein